MNKFILVSRKLEQAGAISQMPRVMVESPLGGDYQRNVEYAKLAVRHSICMTGESAMAFHLIYTQSLCDDTDVERTMGIERSFAWHEFAEKKLFYIDRGFSNGMMLGYLHAVKSGIGVEFRTMSHSEGFVKLVEDLNSEPQTKETLLALSDLLKMMAKNQIANDVGEEGDCNGFRESPEIMSALKSMKAEKDVSAWVEHDRIAARNSLVDMGDAPLPIDLFYREIFPDKPSGIDIDDIAQSWIQVSDGIIDYKESEHFNAYFSNDNAEDYLVVIERVNASEYASIERDMSYEMT